MHVGSLTGFILCGHSEIRKANLSQCNISPLVSKHLSNLLHIRRSQKCLHLGVPTAAATAVAASLSNLKFCTAYVATYVMVLSETCHPFNEIITPLQFSLWNVSTPFLIRPPTVTLALRQSNHDEQAFYLSHPRPEAVKPWWAGFLLHTIFPMKYHQSHQLCTSGNY